MKKRILEYRERIDRCLNGDTEVESWELLMEEHLVQVGFFQHERLVHLLVTLTFAILTVGSVLAVIISGYLPLILLVFVLMILLVPYVAHYYLLENEVQKMYVQYDKILERVSLDRANRL